MSIWDIVLLTTAGALIASIGMITGTIVFILLNRNTS